MDVYDIVRADELEANDQILVTRIIKRQPTKVAFIIGDEKPVTEGDSVIVKGESLDSNANDLMILWADEDVELWSV